MMHKILAVLCGGLAVAACYHYPFGWVAPATGMLLLGAVLWVFPRIWMFLVPALLPVGDLSPLTGRLFLNEFDMVVFTVCLVSYCQKSDSRERLRFPRGAGILVLVLTVLYGISAVKGMVTPGPFELEQVTHPYSRYASLGMIKGYATVLLLIPLMRLSLFHSDNIRRFVFPGMLTGLGLVCFFALWERQLFSGLFNFSKDFRITSTFFEMNTGGAFLDVYLSMCLPFAAACVFFYRHPVIRLAGTGLFCAGLYTLLVTFSRICYASFAVSMVSLTLGAAVMQKNKWKPALAVLALAGLTAVMALPVLKGGYIMDRFAGLSESVDTRIRHWVDAVKKMDQDGITLLFGMGPGTYPAAYFQNPDHIRPGIYEIPEQNGDRFLRLYPGDSLYFGQLIDPMPDKAYTLTVDVRTSRAGSGLTFPICEKSMLYSFNCQWHTIRIGADGPNREPYKIRYENLNIGQGRFYQARPVNFAIYNGSGKDVFEIDNVQLKDKQGNNLVKNGGFSKGSHFWFFATDNHLPWHIKNLWLSQFFDTGMLGLLGFFSFVLYTLAVLAKSMAAKDLMPLILFSSFCGFFTVGLIDSPFDAPRITFLYYFLSIVSLLYAGSKQQNVTK